MKKGFTVTKGGNSKLGVMYSFSLPALITCIDNAPCEGVCYARKGRYVFPNVINCYARNLAQWLENGVGVLDQILKQIPDNKTALCRINASGDLVDMEYLEMIVKLAFMRPSVKFMLFTKKYQLVNEYLNIYHNLPENFNIIFSKWTGLDMDNPHNMAIAEVSDTKTTCPNQYNNKITCNDCQKCWNLGKGKTVIFKKH